MLKRFVVRVLALSAALAVCPVHGAQPLTPESIQADIHRHGVNAAASRVFAQAASRDALMAGVASGNVRWVRVGVGLQAVTDAGDRSELHDAMYIALARQPAVVLQLAVPAFPVEVLCAGRADPLATLRESLAEVDAVRHAVRAVKAPALAAKKAACLSALDKGRADLIRFFAESSSSF